MKKSLLSICSIAVVVLCLGAIYSFTIVSKPTTITGKNVEWITFEEAIAETTKAFQEGRKPKKMFLDIYTDWCGWCKKMDAETFEQPEIAAYLNKHFYPIKFNAEQKDSIVFAGQTFKYVPNGRRGYHQLAAALLGGKMSYPTVVFAHFNKNNFELLQRIPGYLNIPTFDMIMHYLAGEHYMTTPWPDYQKKYKEKQAAKKPAPQQPISNNK